MSTTSLIPLLSLSKLLAATVTVLITTLDDCVWLVPFVAHAAQQGKYHIATVHAILFVATLTGLAVAVCLTTALVAHLMVTNSFIPSSDADLYLPILGAALCWILAGFLYIRAIRKRRRRQQQREQQEQQRLLALMEQGSVVAPDTEATRLLGKKETPTTNLENKSNGNGEPEAEEKTLQPFLVISLTCLGSLDELMYFPSLLLGNVYTWLELCLGAFFAACIMLLVVLCFLRPCQPLMHFLDQIPLYGVVTCFACLLTGQVIWEIFYG